MEPIPKPLLRRLILTFLVGIGCFVVGLALFVVKADRSFFTLSALILLGSLIKAALLHRLIRRKAYTTIEGTCMDVRLKMLGQSREVLLTDPEGQELRLLIGKEHKIQPGSCYRFYFKDASGISPGKNPLMEKALLTDNLLGVEALASLPEPTETTAQDV